jgi:ubiquinone/menaquinone biosynthesis C-methylase UbiE
VTKECLLSSKINEVFNDVDSHQMAAELIMRHSTNKADIRKIALQDLDISACRNILDLGCGFGLFTEALKGKVHPDAVITGVDAIGKYEPLFLNTCAEAGIEGKFILSDASFIENFKDKSFDLILCSYALYFFRETIPHISRILTEEGIFVTITHCENNMEELIDAAKDVLKNEKIFQLNKLPVEIIIDKFTSRNCHSLLSPWFGRVVTKNYNNSLILGQDEMKCLIEYFRFKSPLFLTDTGHGEEITPLLAYHLQKIIHSRKLFTMNKDDIICICSSPFHQKERS